MRKQKTNGFSFYAMVLFLDCGFLAVVALTTSDYYKVNERRCLLDFKMYLHTDPSASCRD